MPPERIEPGDTHYFGKRLLVGITYLDADGEVTRQEQFVSTITEANEDHIVVERKDTGEHVSLPPMVEEASPGEYHLRSTGETVVDPDYVATWDLEEPDPDEA